MTEFTFSVADEVFDKFPDYIVGWIAVRIDPAQAPHDRIVELLRASEERSRVIFEGKDLKENVAIAAWRSAFTSLGWSASKYPSSVEALTRRVVRGYQLPSINPAVDLANATSLTYLVPVGCHDMQDSIELTVRPASGDEEFLPMSDTEQEAPAPGEFIYASGKQVRTRRWVWRQSRDALVDADARWLFFPIDGFADKTAANVETATRFLKTSVTDLLDGSATSGLITRDTRSACVEVATD